MKRSVATGAHDSVARHSLDPARRARLCFPVRKELSNNELKRLLRLSIKQAQEARAEGRRQSVGGRYAKAER